MKSQTNTTPRSINYPSHPITVIVPYSAGGPIDLIARSLQKTAQKYLDQPLIVINKPGGTGTVGWNELASSKPDGYTIGLTAPELFIQPLFSNTKYNYATALEPIVHITANPFVMAVLANSPNNSVSEVIDYAKKHPGELKFGHTGIGSFGHIAGEIFARNSGININQVPFQGASEVIPALLGGHIQIAFVNPSAVKEFVNHGSIKVLAVSSKQRLKDPVLANAPTFQEQGLDIVQYTRFGLSIPKETPQEVKDILTTEFIKITTDPEFIATIKDLGLVYEYLGPEESRESWLKDSQELSALVEELGIIDLIKSQKK